MAGPSKSRAQKKLKDEGALLSLPRPTVDAILISQANLRRQLSVSPMTFWRWRVDKELGFPPGLCINRRVYFRWAEVQAWLARQQRTA
jgi:hypothetical protein